MTPQETVHKILHEFIGRPCRGDAGWCDARDHAEAIVVALSKEDQLEQLTVTRRTSRDINLRSGYVLGETYRGPIEVGSHFIWEAHIPRAWALIVVTRIDTKNSHGIALDETMIWAKVLHSTGVNKIGSESWNEESRFREAVTPCDVHGNIILGNKDEA